MTDTTRGTTRRRWRRRLLLAGLLPLLLALAFAGKVAVMLAYDHAGRTAYTAGGYADARGSFAANATLNHLESWISPYDEGTARYRLDDFPGAVAALTAALRTVPPEEECRVRINLSLAHESVGDAAVAGGEREDARRSWRTAARTLTEGGCLELSPETEAELEAELDAELEAELDAELEAELRAELGAAAEAELARVRSATEVDRRLRDKLRQQPRTPPVPEDDDASSSARTQAQTAAARLARRNEQAQEQRREQQQRRRDREAEEDRQEQREQQTPPSPGSGDDDGEPLTYEW